jgi:hypothetical protein
MTANGMRASSEGRTRCIAGHSQYRQYGVMARRLAAATGSTREMPGPSSGVLGMDDDPLQQSEMLKASRRRDWPSAGLPVARRV